MTRTYNNASAAETGRFYVKSAKTGRTYCVEPIMPRQADVMTHWGDVNPATKKVEGDYGDKYTGAIRPEDSIITKENGYDDIHFLDKGVSPLSYIEDLDAKYLTQLNATKV
ncbi:MAG: hypothetical protein JWO03_216 [Bacteroidetes bacterium]|nr:hypothetical protein [Bacteroidota bacterium]